MSPPLSPPTYKPIPYFPPHFLHWFELYVGNHSLRFVTLLLCSDVNIHLLSTACALGFATHFNPCCSSSIKRETSASSICLAGHFLISLLLYGLPRLVHYHKSCWFYLPAEGRRKLLKKFEVGMMGRLYLFVQFCFHAIYTRLYQF